MRLARGMLGAVLLVALTGCAFTSVVLDDRPADDASKPEVPPAEVTLPPSSSSVAGWEVGPDGLVAEIGLVDRAQGGVSYTVGAHGSVVRIADSSVFMDRADLSTWTLDPVELRTLLTRLTAVRAGNGPPGAADPTSGPMVWVGYWTNGVERRFATTDSRALDLLREMGSRLGTMTHRWVPREIGFLAGRPNRTAQSPLGPRDPFARWPLATGVRELAHGTLPDAYGEQKLAICLRGRAARRAWTLFTGVNTAYLRVDDGRRWELQSFVTLPGYRAVSSPCSPGAVPPS